MSRIAQLAFLVAVFFLVGWDLRSPQPDRCSYSVIPSRADHGTAILLARASSDTVFVGIEPLPPFLGEEQPTQFAARPVWGQRFRVQDIVGRGQPLFDELGRDFAALFVPWGDDDINCLPGPWNGSYRWLDEDYLGVHVALLRRRSDWIGGVPTFDIPYAGQQPYGWSGDTIPADVIGAYMTATELFSLNRLLTAPSDSLATVDVFMDWALANPDAARTYPASQMGQWTRR